MKHQERIGETYLFNGEKVTIIEEIRGGLKNKKAFYLSKRKERKPCTYLLSNGFRVRFDKLETYNCIIDVNKLEENPYK